MANKGGKLFEPKERKEAPVEVNEQTPVAKQSVDSMSQQEKNTLKEAVKPSEADQRSVDTSREHPEAAKLQTAPPEVFQQPTDKEHSTVDTVSQAEKNNPASRVQPTDQGKRLDQMSTREKDEISAKTGLQPAQAIEQLRQEQSPAQSFERNGALQNDSRLTNKGSRKA